MAALLVSCVEGLSSQLGSSSFSFLKFMCCFCFGDKKTELNGTLTAARALLLDADEQQDHTHYEVALIEKLQPILHEAEDLVEEIEIYETADVERRNILCRFFKTTIPFHIQTPWKLKAINERLAEFKAERAKLPQSGRDGGYRNRNEEMRMEQPTYTRSADIIGREKDKEAIKNMLKEDGSNVPIIIAIIGMGGLGKTTLARSVYDDGAEGFDLKIKVWVSQNFDVKRLLIEVIEAATKEKCKLTGMTHLESKLGECLDGKKYLLVLDDIWNTNYNSWNHFENLLKGGAKGSVILATTREKNVASIMVTDPKYIYELKGLDKDDCWSLFEQQVRFKIDQMEEKQMFVAIGKKILNKCGGNPLAIKAVGGLLCSTDRKKWQNIENDRLWSQAQEGNILPALKVSYARLPYHLKKCFAYCSLFRRGYEIEKTMLTQLWFAQGFVDLHSNNGLLADSADECFNELRNRSFLQDEKNDKYGDVTSCKLHDLMFDLAREVAGSECVIVYQDGVPNISERVIHASVKAYCINEATFVDGISPTKTRNLRTLLRSGHYGDNSKPNFYTTFKCLRVLELTHVLEHNSNVLNSLRKLVHLRYLDLSESKIRMLPNFICKLRYLQTLKVNGCDKLEELPGDIKKLVSLIHLENRGCDSLKGMPLGIGQLTSIQTLPEFVLGGEGWAGLSELEGLNNLRGHLSIYLLQNARNAISESTKAFYLKDKKHLQSLELHWYYGGEDDRDVALLERLQPNPDLKGALIRGYGGVKFPSWMDNIGKSLPNLVAISLIECPSCECLPLFVDQLRSLKLLFLWNLPKLEYIRSYVSDISYPPTSSSSPFNSNILSGAAGFFPALKEVSLLYLRELKEWSIDFDDGGKPKTDSAAATQPKRLLSLNTLSTLAIRRCPKLTSMPSLPNIEELKLNGISGALIQSMTMAETICPTTSSLPSFLTLSKLKSLEITECEDLVYLPQGWLENFTSLERLLIRDCAQLKSLSRETPHMPKDLQSCRKLRSLKLENLPKLKEWSIEVIVGDDGGKPKTDSAAATQPKRLLSLNTLSTLEIDKCPELTSMPSFPNIEELRLDNISGALIQSMTMAETICPTTSSLPSFLTLSKLKSLLITCCKDLVYLPQEWLENLERLKIEDCAQLESLSRETPHMPKDLKGKALDFPEEEEEEEEDLQSWRKLRSLELVDLPKLSSLPKGLQHATELELHIHYCDSLVNWLDSMENITSLHSLDIRGFQTLTSLPQGLRRFTALKNLAIWDCPGLVCLPDWLGNVTSLRQLEIRLCDELKSIPETVRCLTALQLFIYKCPHLSETDPCVVTLEYARALSRRRNRGTAPISSLIIGTEETKR